MSKNLEATIRRAIMTERMQRGMSLLFVVELLWLAGTFAMGMHKVFDLGNWGILVGGVAFFGLMWLRRYPVFCKGMCLFFVALWVSGFAIWSYTFYGLSPMTVCVTLLTLVFIGGIHKWGLWEMDDWYAR